MLAIKRISAALLPFSDPKALDSQMLPAVRTSLRRLLLAILVGALAVVVRAVAQPLLGDSLPFLIAFPAVVLASLLWGTIPGVVTASLCAIAAWVPSIPPNITPSRQPIELGGFAISALFISFACAQLGSFRSFGPPSSMHGPKETPLGSWLRVVLFGALFVPLSAFVGASWWSLDRAEAASQASLSHASDLAYHQAERAFAVAQEIATRADGASSFPNDEARAREPSLHLRLSDMAAGLSAVVNANVWDASGTIVARSDHFPVNPEFTISDRGYFQQLRTSAAPLAVSEVMVGRQSGKVLFNVAVRRHSSDGAFNGIVTVALAPSFFSAYYQSLVQEEASVARFALVRSDGAVLARWPEATGSDYLAVNSSLIRRVSSGSESGQLTITADAGRADQVVAFHRVGTLPVYVIAGISRTAMLSGWARFVGVLAVILLPTTAGLVYVTWVALRKTRKEAAISAELQSQIDARTSAERRVLEAQRLETLSFVTGSVAHDFNNMLSVITSSLHVHKIQRPETVDDKPLAAISRSVQAGVRLTRQLLSFSKKQVLRPELIRLQTWLPTAEALMRSTLGSAASWTSSVEDDAQPIKVDPAELELALINVVLNAKLAMPRGGALSVRVSVDKDAPRDAPMTIVCVIDTGEGIPAEVLPKVFQPFFTTRERGVGSGLGLTQVQAFCAQSGGRVTIESVPGQTTLCMHLPAVLEETTPAPETAAAPLQTLQARLLLVEDHDEVAKTTELMLRSSGLTVVRVASADAALAYLATAAPAPEIVLSDVAMPGSMNGIGLAIELQRLYPTLPVMLHTGYAEQIEDGTAKGMRIFQKPVAPAVMLAELGALLSGADKPLERDAAEASPPITPPRQGIRDASASPSPRR